MCLGARTQILRENIVQTICALLQDIKRVQQQNPDNHAIQEFDFDGVIDGCIGAIHVCRKDSIFYKIGCGL